MDTIGKRFGRWTVLELDVERTEIEKQRVKNKEIKNWDYFFVCKCDCGTTRSVRYKNLKGCSQSCGCLKNEQSVINGKKNKRYNKYDLSGDFGVGWTNGGYEFYFDLDDYELIKDYCWHKHQDGYLRTRYDYYINEEGKVKNKYILMHRLIMCGFDKDLKKEVDHIDGSPNNNLRSNMRIVTHSQNMKNIKLYKDSKSGKQGVTFDKKYKKWKAAIRSDAAIIHLGTFDNKEDAIKARVEAEIKYYGEFRRKEEHYTNGTR